jgi:hypothetical protein
LFSGPFVAGRSEAVTFVAGFYIDKKEKEIFLIYKDIQMGSVAKSYMRKGFLYE